MSRFSKHLPGLALATVAAVTYAVYSIERHARFMSEAFDMAIYDQVVWQWSRFEIPANSIQGFPNELGDHFSPIYALIAPAYWLHAGPVAALIVQALLIGASIVAVERASRRRLGSAGGLAIALSYALCWGVWAAVDFDFHETAFAAALIAWAIDCFDLQRWRRGAVLLAALLFVKEDMGLVVAAFGLWLATRREWRPALWCLAGGLAAFAFINGLVMPALNDGRTSATDHRLYGHLGSGTLDVAGNVLAHPVATIELLGQPAEKLRLVALTLGSFLFLSLLSPIVLIAAPQLVERLLTDDHNYWVPLYHYTLVIAPVLAVAAADGLARLRQRAPRMQAMATALTAGCVLFSVGSAATGPPQHLFEGSFYAQTAMDRTRSQAVAVIPPHAAVAADKFVLPHLSTRKHAYLLSRDGVERSQWVVYEGPRTPKLPGKWQVVKRWPEVVVLRRLAVAD